MKTNGLFSPEAGKLPTAAALHLIATQAVKELAKRGHKLRHSRIAGKPLPRRTGTIKYSRGSG